MSNIKAVYRYIDEASREKFADSQCLLTISVGQEVHENEKFETTIALVNKSFHSCIMLIDDSLQRHTMVLNRIENAEDVYQLAISEGDNWLARNEKYFCKLSNLSKIIRWDAWLKHSDYLSSQEMIKKTIETDSDFKTSFDNTIHEFLQRYCNRLPDNSNFDLERGYKLCFDYLLEECAAMILWPELNCHFEVYPGKRNFAMDETHKRFIIPKWPDLLHSAGVKFKNRKQLTAQTFQFLERPNLSETGYPHEI